jgi:hypothetical protein
MLLELCRYLNRERRLWLLPVIFALLLIGGLMVLAQGSVLAPLIYTLF